MASYRNMYNKLFKAASAAIHILQQAQIDVEEEYISQEEPDIHILTTDEIDNSDDK